MTKRSLKQIQEILAEQFYKYRRRGDDPGPEMGGGSYGLGGVTRSPSQFGGGSNKVQKPTTPTTPTPPAAPPTGRPKVWRGPEGQTVVPKAVQKPRITPAQAREYSQQIKKDTEQAVKANREKKAAELEKDYKVWRRGSEEKGTSNVSGSGSKPPPGKEPPMSADKSGRREIPDPLTAKEKRSSAYKSGGIHAAAALAALIGLEKDKDKDKAGGAEPGSDDSGITWIDTKDFVPTDTVNKDAVDDPKSSAAVTQEPARTPEAPIPEPEIRLEPVKPAKQTDVTEPDKKPAEPERVAPKKEKTVPVPDPAPVTPAPSEKTVSSSGGSQGRTDTPSRQPKDRAGTTLGGTGAKTSPDGTGPASGDQPGPDSGPGTRAKDDYEFRKRGTMTQIDIMESLEDIQSRLVENYRLFLQEDNKKKDPKNESKISERKEQWTREQIEKLAQETAEKYNVPWPLAKALMRQESGTSARADIVSSAGAIGPMQLMPDTAKGLKVNPYDVRQNIDGGMRFLKQNYEKYRGNLHHTLSAYNAGPAATDAWISGQSYYAPDRKTGKPILYNARKQVNPTGAPWAETVDYQQKIINNLITDTKGWETLTARSKELGGETVARAERKLGDKFRDQYANLVPPGDSEQAALPTIRDSDKPGYYTVGDSHGEGIAVYGKGKDGLNWINKSKVGASVVDKDQFATHMANIESIPAGSVVTISGGANDISRSNHQAIVDNLNKLIAASKARGHKVVYVLPTESPDPAKQEQREALRQTILKGVKDVPIVDLGMASKTDKQQVHLDSKGYNRIAKNISDMFVPDATARAGKLPLTDKPIGTIVQPDYSKYKVGDLGPLEKIGPNQWRSTSTGQIVSDAPELENLPSLPKPETFLDKVKRTLPPALGGKGELVSQVFGDKKKPAVEPAKTAEPSKTPSVAIDKEQSGTELFKKIYGTDKAKEVQAKWSAEVDKKEQERKRQSLGLDPGEEIVDVPLKKEPSKEIDPEKIKVNSEPPEKTAVVPVATPVKVEKPDSTADKDVGKLLTKDQTGLVKAKRELSDFEREFAARRAKGDQEFTWYTKDGKPYQVTTRLKGEKSVPTTVTREPVTDKTVVSQLSKEVTKDYNKDLGLDSGEEIVDIPKVTNISNRFNAQDSDTEVPSSSEIQQAIKDFERQQADLDLGKKIIGFDDQKLEKTTNESLSINTELRNILKLAGRL